MSVFFTRKDFKPMTAAERQRRCRANGKGRHRGHRPTQAQTRAYVLGLIEQAEAAAPPSVEEATAQGKILIEQATAQGDDLLAQATAQGQLLIERARSQ